MGFNEDMELLKRQMRQLEIEYDQWFSGILAKPPWETRKVVEDLIRKHGRNPPRSLAEQSVFQMLQAKFNTYSEMWGRRQRLKEEGRIPSGAEERSRAAGSRPASTSDARPQPDPFREVFDSYVAAMRLTGKESSKLSYESFRAQLEKKAAEFRRQRGLDVEFGVSTKDGKVSLIARPKK